MSTDIDLREKTEGLEMGKTRKYYAKKFRNAKMKHRYQANITVIKKNGKQVHEVIAGESIMRSFIALIIILILSISACSHTSNPIEPEIIIVDRPPHPPHYPKPDTLHIEVSTD